MKKSIYKRRVFFYGNTLIIRSKVIVGFMQWASRTPKNKSLQAAAFFPGLVFIADSKILTHQGLTHEATHAIQATETAILSFLLLVLATDVSFMSLCFLSFISYWFFYIFDFLLIRMFFSHHVAYLLSAFEQEAWLNETNRSYLEKRIPFSWLYYMFRNLLSLRRVKKREQIFYRVLGVRLHRKKHFYWLMSQKDRESFKQEIGSLLLFSKKHLESLKGERKEQVSGCFEQVYDDFRHFEKRSPFSLYKNYEHLINCLWQKKEYKTGS